MIPRQDSWLMQAGHHRKCSRPTCSFSKVMVVHKHLHHPFSTEEIDDKSIEEEIKFQGFCTAEIPSSNIT